MIDIVDVELRGQELAWTLRVDDVLVVARSLRSGQVLDVQSSTGWPLAPDRVDAVADRVERVVAFAGVLSKLASLDAKR